MNRNKENWRKKQRRHWRVRRKVFGTPERPRLSVYRSLKNIYCQIVDDTAGRTLVSSSSLLPQIREQIGYGGNKAASALVGKDIAEKAIQKGIKHVRFDRGSCKYHGRIKALADAAREGGLIF